MDDKYNNFNDNNNQNQNNTSNTNQEKTQANPYDIYNGNPNMDKNSYENTTSPERNTYVAGDKADDRTVPPTAQRPVAPQHTIASNQSQPVTKKTLNTVLVVCIVCSLIVGVLGGVLGYKLTSNGSSIVYQTDTSVDTNGSENVGDGKTIADVIETASQSVVEITTETVQTSTFLQQYVTEGAGSGVIISSDGYIITNNHVISGASKITVRTKAGQSYQAQLVGTDSTTDVALLKIDASDLTPAVLGDSDSLSVGDTAIAIGNPLGELGGTVTTGIISALDREITLDGNTMDLLQTDAAINPGNSGGGLFNSNGELIGIVVAKSSGEDVEGLGFAIPINKVKTVTNDLSAYGYVKGRPMLGASLVDVNTVSAARQYGVSQLGVYVYSVTDGSGAQKAGLKSGDLIQAIDGTVVSSSTEVKSIIQQHVVGDTINITIVRDGKQQSVDVTLTESTNTQ